MKRKRNEAAREPPATPPTFSSTADAAGTHDPYGAMRYRDYRLLLIGSFVGGFGQQMLSIALGWELYNRTRSALVLGGIGLAQVIPLILLTLPAGHVADRYNRRYVVMAAQAVLVLGSLGLAALSAAHGPLLLIYGCLVVIGGASSFSPFRIAFSANGGTAKSAKGPDQSAARVSPTNFLPNQFDEGTSNISRGVPPMNPGEQLSERLPDSFDAEIALALSGSSS